MMTAILTHKDKIKPEELPPQICVSVNHLVRGDHELEHSNQLMLVFHKAKYDSVPIGQIICHVVIDTQERPSTTDHWELHLNVDRGSWQAVQIHTDNMAVEKQNNKTENSYLHHAKQPSGASGFDRYEVNSPSTQ